MKVVDFFCGAGGMSEGFRQAGWNVVAGVDSDAEALYTHHENFPDAISVNADLSVSSTAKKVAGDIRARCREVDAVIGGPPCQGFSIAGKRQEEDPRNKLYQSFLSLVRLLDPSVVVMENVPTIINMYGGKVAEAIRTELEELGFRTSVFPLNSADYGVPQLRKRAFFIGIRGSTPMIPTPTSIFDAVTTKMAISDLPLLENEPGGGVMDYSSEPQSAYQTAMRVGSQAIYNHWAVQHTDKTKSIIDMVPDGGNYKSLPPELWSTRKVNIAWTRMDSGKPCFTIDAGHNHHFHYKANRVPTVRECARIQSFPDVFRFFGKKTSQFRQVGNAVPPLLAKAIAKQIMDRAT